MRVPGDRVLPITNTTVGEGGREVIVVGDPINGKLTEEQLDAMHNTFVVDYEPVELYDYLDQGLDIKLAEFSDGVNRSLLQPNEVDARFVDFLNKKYDELSKADQALYQAFQHGFSELEPHALKIQDFAKADYRGAYQSEKAPSAYLETLLKTPAYHDAFVQFQKDYPQDSDTDSRRIFFARARRILRDQIARPSGTDMREVVGIQKTAFNNSSKLRVSAAAAVVLSALGLSAFYASASSSANIAAGHETGFAEGKEIGYDEGTKLKDSLAEVLELKTEDRDAGKFRAKTLPEILDNFESKGSKELFTQVVDGLLRKLKIHHSTDVDRDNLIITRSTTPISRFSFMDITGGPFKGRSHLTIPQGAFEIAYHSAYLDTGLQNNAVSNRIAQDKDFIPLAEKPAK